MRVRLFTIAISVSMLCSGAAPANVAVSPRAPSAELPMTDDFANVLGSYRDCVIGGVERAALGPVDAVTSAAMAACADDNRYVRAQLLSDIQASTPGVSDEAAIGAMEKGMAVVEPMIAAIARDHAAEVAQRGAASEAPAWSDGVTVG